MIMGAGGVVWEGVVWTDGPVQLSSAQLSSAPPSRGQDAPCSSGIFAPDLTSPLFLFVLDSSA